MNLFPNQLKYKYLYKGKKKIEDIIFNFISKKLSFSKKYKFKMLEDSKTVTNEMASNLVQIDFLIFLIQIFKPKNILEIGSFIGKSTLSFAKYSDKNCKIYTIERWERIYKILLKNIKNNKLQKKIIPFLGDGKEIIKKLGKKKFDFIFIDGNKENYKEYLNYSRSAVSANGVIIVDDIFFHGDVFNKIAKTKKGFGLKRMLSFLETKFKNYKKTIIPISNGILILKK